MGGSQLLALGVIAFGVYYLWTSGALSDLTSALGGSTVALPPNVSTAGRAATAELREAQQEEAATAARRSGAGAVSFATAGAGTAAGLAGAAGVGATGALGGLALTGYGAAAALLVWGITQRGWFRGGEEGVRVNPARDEFMNEFVKVYYGDPFSFTREQINEYRYLACLKAFEERGVPGNIVEQVMSQLYAADTMVEFEAAAQNFLRVLRDGR